MGAKKTVRAKLEAELKHAEGQVGKYVSRPGVDYARFGYQLDAGIATRRDFAVRWRRRVLELAGDKELTERRVRAIKPVRFGFDGGDRTYRVFAADGKDIYAVCPTAGPNCFDGCYGLLPDERDARTLAELLDADGWKIVGG